LKTDNFFAELKRRNVIRMAGLYLVAAWLLTQVTSTVLPMFAAPEWLPRSIVTLLAIGFIPALIFSWIFELTPEGFKRDQEVPPERSIAPQNARRMDRMIIVVLLLALGYFALDKFLLNRSRDTALVRETTIPGKSIAVLPFDNLSRDPDNAYFTEGVQDEILTRLAKVADLKVISRTSTQHFKSAPDNLPEIAKKLGVMHILEGSVQKANDQVRVNVQLINALNDTHLWADTYDRKLTDIFAVESEIAKTIADTLQAKLTGSEKTLLANKPTTDPEAYELYLKGRFFWNKRTAEDLRKAIDFFNQAIAQDPEFALAYAALAQSWLILPAYGGGAPKDCLPPAEVATTKALALDGNSSDAHAALGMLRAGYHFDFSGGTKEYERALELNPNDATSHHWFATDVLAALGESEREIAEMRRARELDPLSLVINTNLGEALRRAGRLDEAISQLRQTVEMDGTFYFAHHALGVALERKGQFDKALDEYKKSVALTDDPVPLGLLGHLLGTLGHRDEASGIIKQLQTASAQRYVDPYNLAIVFLGLGDREQALSLLEKSYAERNGNSLEYIRTDPMLDSVRGDPRFEALAEKIVPAREFKGVATTR
jgi:TolB-like protein/Flp pilus assembly protein TadD